MADATLERRRRQAGRAAAVGLAAIAVAAGCAAPAPWLVDVAAEHGVAVVYDTGQRPERHMPEIMGGGVAVFDYDNDGDLDLYFANGNDALPTFEPDPGRTDRLLRREADGRYTDVTVAAGVGDGLFSMGVAAGDVDNDGDVDLYVTNYGPDRLYRNNGDGTFADATAASGIDERDWSVGAAFLDFDRDGWLDLYVGEYLLYEHQRPCRTPAGAPEWCGPESFNDRADILYRNDGDGTFTDVSQAAGIAGAAYSAMGVVVDDFDDDGWPDLYVANDADPNLMWLNQRDGTFRDAATRLGAAVNARGDPEAGMGVVADDLSGDGLVDLFVTHLSREKNTLYRNLGAGRGFVDASAEAGLAAPSLPFTGFGTAAVDLELDGDLDLFVANGRVNSDLPPLAGARPPAPWDVLAEPNHVYRQEAPGAFALLDAAACPPCALAEVSRGVASGDLDADGDEDLVVVQANGPAQVLDNRSPRRGRWLSVRAVDPVLRRDALGARVTVRAGGRAWTRTVRANASYASASDPRLHFGLGETAAVDGIDVRWPDGAAESFAATCVDCRVELRRGAGAAR